MSIIWFPFQFLGYSMYLNLNQSKTRVNLIFLSDSFLRYCCLRNQKILWNNINETLCIGSNRESLYCICNGRIVLEFEQFFNSSCTTRNNRMYRKIIKYVKVMKSSLNSLCKVQTNIFLCHFHSHLSIYNQIIHVSKHQRKFWHVMIFHLYFRKMPIHFVIIKLKLHSPLCTSSSRHYK